MHGLRLPAHIHYGLFDGERIFLDLETDRYFQLPPEEGQLFEALEQQRLVPASGCARLTKAGLLNYASDGRMIRPTQFAEPAASLLEEPRPCAEYGVATVLEAWSDLLAARWTIRRRKLAALQLAAGRDSAAAGGAADPAHAVRQFHAARKFVPLQSNCLRDSLALRHFLKRRGIAASLIIGAKLHPFAAHCLDMRRRL